MNRRKPPHPHAPSPAPSHRARFPTTTLFFALVLVLLGCAQEAVQGPPGIQECEELDRSLEANMSPRVRALVAWGASRRALRATS